MRDGKMTCSGGSIEKRRTTSALGRKQASGLWTGPEGRLLVRDWRGSVRRHQGARSYPGYAGSPFVVRGRCAMASRSPRYADAGLDPIRRHKKGEPKLAFLFPTIRRLQRRFGFLPALAVEPGAQGGFQGVQAVAFAGHLEVGVALQ